MQTRKELLTQYRKKHGMLKVPKQGWDSLAWRLHLPYSMGIVRGFTDLGTYVNKPLDHGGTDTHRGKPAWAFDLGRKDRFLFKGWGYLKARRLAKLFWENHKALDIEYIILGKKIISRSYPYWRYYGDPGGSHGFHMHVSGHWPGRGEV